MAIAIFPGYAPSFQGRLTIYLPTYAQVPADTGVRIIINFNEVTHMMSH